MTKRILFFLVLLLSTGISFAQSVDDVKDELGKDNWDILKAKGMIDKIMANPKKSSDAEAWYYKGFIYNQLSKADSLKTYCDNCKMEAFNAFKQYQLMDKNNVLMLIKQNAPLFDIYNGYFDLAIKAFNANDYTTAYTNFKNAGMVEDYIRSKDFDYNGFKFPALDTSLIQNTALAARLNKDSAGSALYYKKMTDANLADPQYLIAYEFQASYYLNQKDIADFNAIVEKGKKIFPKEEFWTAIQVEQIEESGTKTEVFNKYDEMLKQDTSNYILSYNYAVDLYNYIFANDDKTAQVDQYREPLHILLKKTIAIKSTGEDNLLMAKYLYNSSFDNSDSARKMKGTGPDATKKRKALIDLATAQLEECLPYALASATYYESLPTMKPTDKANYRSTLSVLESIYEVKKDQAKVDEYDKKMKAMQ